MLDDCFVRLSNSEGGGYWVFVVFGWVLRLSNPYEAQKAVLVWIKVGKERVLLFQIFYYF